MNKHKPITPIIQYRNNYKKSAQDDSHEFCPRCEANITMQKGYSNELPYWVCKGCGEMLINPEVPGDIAWICDQCESMLNIQDGFNETCGHWVCTECGFNNDINSSQIFLSDDEYRADHNSPYKGLSDEDMLAISLYIDEIPINNHDNVIIVRNIDDNKLYVKKILDIYDATVYRYLKEHPVEFMPKIIEVYESNNNLIVIEEYIDGKTLFEVINENVIEPSKAVHIARQISGIAKALHTLENPIIHRDIKPSNIILKNDEAYLLDINAAKWFKEDEIEDTKLLGTKYYAAPEQLGYSMKASSEKTDIYSIGVLLNRMVTGKYPKEEKAPGAIWNIVECCIRLEPSDRYTDDELISALDNILG